MKVQEEYARVIEREDFRSCLKILPHAIEILHGTLGNQQNQGVLCSMLTPQLGCPIQHALLPTRVSYLTCFSSIGRIETSPPIQGVLFFQPVPLPLVELRPLPQGVQYASFYTLICSISQFHFHISWFCKPRTLL